MRHENIIDGPKIRVWSRDCGSVIEIAIFQDGADGRTKSVVQKLEFVEQRDEDQGMPGPHLMYLRDHTAQILMDDLWRCGIRPTEGSGSAGSLNAVQDHLKDMRKVAFKFLKIDQKDTK